MLVYTKESMTKVFNQNGGAHGISPIRGVGTPINVDPVPKTIKGVSEKCYKFASDKYNVYIPISKVTTTNPNTVPPVVVPPPASSQLYTVKGDEELEYKGNDFLNYKSRTQLEGWSYGAVTPSVFRFGKFPAQSPTEYFVNISAMDNDLKRINEYRQDEARINRLYSPGTAVMNRHGFPYLQYLVMSGCQLEPIEIVENCLKFKTLLPESNVSQMTYQTHPQFVMRWDLVTYRNGETLHVIDRKGEIYWFLVTKEGHGYIPLEWVRENK